MRTFNHEGKLFIFTSDLENKENQEDYNIEK
jgi:hypothetical protein